jgi:hypothetical protein
MILTHTEPRAYEQLRASSTKRFHLDAVRVNHTANRYSRAGPQNRLEALTEHGMVALLGKT